MDGELDRVTGARLLLDDLGVPISRFQDEALAPTIDHDVIGRFVEGASSPVEAAEVRHNCSTYISWFSALALFPPEHPISPIGTDRA